MWKIKCQECGKFFECGVSSDHFPGGKEREYIYCPYCKAENGSEITSGIIWTKECEQEDSE